MPMQIVIKETGTIRKLAWTIDGVDCVQDFIGNNGGWDSFSYDDDRDVYIVSQADFNWWDKVIEDNIVLYDHLSDYRFMYGAEAVNEAINHIDCDLEDYAASVYQALEDTFGKYDQ